MSAWRSPATAGNRRMGLPSAGALDSCGQHVPDQAYSSHTPWTSERLLVDGAAKEPEKLKIYQVGGRVGAAVKLAHAQPEGTGELRLPATLS